MTQYELILRTSENHEPGWIIAWLRKNPDYELVDLPEMDEDELRELIVDVIVDDPRIALRFTRSTGADDPERCPVGKLRKFQREEWGEDIVGIRFPLENAVALKALEDFASESGLRIWDTASCEEWGNESWRPA